MMVLNFSHPLTPDQLAQIETLTGLAPLQVMDVPTQLDDQLPFAPQVAALVEGVSFSRFEWQNLPIVVVLPMLNAIAVILLSELHGRMGHFPPIVRLRRVQGARPVRFEVAEVINLQSVHDAARTRR